MTPLEVLINKKKGTMLYSPCFGNMVFNQIDTYSKSILATNFKNTFCEAFLPDGRNKNEEGAEIILFPSKNMHNWEKFAWKKGDVLRDKDNLIASVEFIEFVSYEDYPKTNENYTHFKGRILSNNEIHTFDTELFKKCGYKDFKPFDKILYICDSIYQVDIVKYEDDNGRLHTFEEPPLHINSVYPYKEEMAEFVGHKVTEETEKKLEEILNTKKKNGYIMSEY